MSSASRTSPIRCRGPEEVLVDIRATALNRADLLQRMGFYPNPFPEALGDPRAGVLRDGAIGAVSGRGCGKPATR